MIILDTNGVSALMRRESDSSVLNWLNGSPAESVSTTSVTVFEVRLGLEMLPQGRRRRLLEEEFTKTLRDDLGERILSLDVAGAATGAVVAAKQRQAGRSFEIRDVQIAGIALARRATLATRNIKHFEGIGLSLVNPWAL